MSSTAGLDTYPVERYNAFTVQANTGLNYVKGFQAMPAPQRLRIYGAGLLISAFVLPEMDQREGSKVSCRHCAPRRTTMKVLATLFPDKQLGERFIMCYECSFCHKQWAIPWVDTGKAATDGQD